MIDFKNVCFGYDKDETIKNVTFHIDKGDFVAVLGANGAGKTTLSKLFNGILKPVSGDVTVSGMNTKTTRTSQLAKHIGFLFQNPDRQICKNTVRDEIMFGLECVSSDKEYCRSQCEKTLEAFGFDGSRDPFTMSRGERQRIALASIIAVEPEVLILDEPTTGLDYAECIHIMEMVKELNQKGVTVIMVTHDMELVLDYAQKVLVMNDGKMLALGQMREVMKNQAVLGEARLLPPQIAGLTMKLEGFEDVYTNEEMLNDVLKRTKA
ncbi:MAG: energy-coupling factor ABC transporter ATP-binding protein [Huintestinicola sp.]